MWMCLDARCQGIIYLEGEEAVSFIDCTQKRSKKDKHYFRVVLQTI